MMTKWDGRFLNMAQLVAGWSKDPSTQVGAVIAGPDKRVISVGFNGFPQGMPDDLALYENREEKYSRIIHAEVNALLFARTVPPGSTLYTWPFLPCDRCVVQMLQAGIRRYVAPVISPEIQARWGESINRTMKYLSESGAEFFLIDNDRCTVRNV